MMVVGPKGNPKPVRVNKGPDGTTLEFLCHDIHEAPREGVRGPKKGFLNLHKSACMSLREGMKEVLIRKKFPKRRRYSSMHKS